MTQPFSTDTNLARIISLKNAFLRNTSFEWVLHPDIAVKVNLENLDQTRRKWVALQKEVVACSTIEEMLPPMKAMKELFAKEIWLPVAKNAPLEILGLLSKFHNQSRIDDPQAFLNKYRKIDKTEAHFKEGFKQEGLEASSIVIKALTFISNNLPKSIKENIRQKNLHALESKLSQLNQIEENIALAQSICARYGFSSFSFSSKKDNFNPKEFMKSTEMYLLEICQRLNIPEVMMGLNKTISFGISYHPFRGGSYAPVNKHLEVDAKNNDASILLHEWIHAVDHLVGSKHPNGYFASELKSFVSLEDTKEKDEDFKDCHGTIRNIVNAIIYDNPKHLEEKVAHAKQETVGIFLHHIMGDAWYAMGGSKRQELLSSNLFPHLEQLATNYCDDSIEILSKKISQHCSKTKEEVKQEMHNQHAFMGRQLPKLIEQAYAPPGLKPSSFMEGFNTFEAKIVYLKRGMLNFFFNKGVPGLQSYFQQPVELLARYFEANVYPEKVAVENKKIGINAYASPDPLFHEHNDKLFKSLARCLDLEYSPTHHRKKKPV